MTFSRTEEQARKVEHWKEQMAEEWQNPGLVEAYRRWSDEEAAWAAEAGKLIVERARLREGMNVLDLASGHGEPALDVARAVGPEGRVTATDVAPGLLEIAEERSRARGLTNIEFRVADAHDLPFRDAAFDRVTCRLGAMYLADPLRALQEARRVLRPEGLASYVVWGPREQPFFDALVGVLFRYVEPPAADPEGPSIFAFAQQGALSSVLTDAGFRDVEEEAVVVHSAIHVTPDRYWQWFVDMAPPFRPLIDSLDAQARERMESEAIHGIKSYYDGESVTIPIEVNVAVCTS